MESPDYPTPRSSKSLPARTGRNQEWETLCSWLEESTIGLGGLGIVSGAAGSGKSFLARHLEQEARERGFATGYGRFAGRGRSRMPWPWPQVLRGLGSPETTKLARVLLREGLEPVEEERDRFLASSGMGAGQLVLPLVDALEAEASPLLLVFDDAQDCDAASGDVLRLVAESLASLPCLILLLLRDDAEVPAGSGTDSVIQSFRGAAEHRILGLPPLTDTEIVGILGEELCLALGGIRNASELTRGNPLLACAVRQAALPAQSLTSTLSTPELALGTIATHRRAELSTRCERLVSALAIRPEGSDAVLLANILKCALEDLEKTAQDPGLKGLVEVESGRGNLRYRITTESMREALAAGISPEHRRDLHAIYAHALIERNKQGTSVAASEVADHAMEATPAFPPTEAARWTCRAARGANTAEAFRSGAALVADGLRTLALEDGHEQQELRKDLLLEGLTANCAFAPQTAREYLRELRQIATRLEPDARRRLAEDVIDAADISVQDLALLEEIRQLLQLALGELSPKDPARIGLIAREAALLDRIPDPAARQASENLSEEALRASEELDANPDLRAIANAIHLLCNHHSREPAARLDMARSLAAYGNVEQHPDLHLIANCTLVTDGLATGLVGEADAAIDQLSRESASATNHPVSWYPFHLRAMRAGMQADFKAARRWLEVGLENASPASYLEAASSAWLLLTHLASRCGVSIFHVPILPYIQLPALPKEFEGADFQIPPPDPQGHPLTEPWGDAVVEIAEASRHAVQPAGISRTPIGASPDLSAHWRVGFAGVLARVLNDHDGARAIIEEMAQQEYGQIPHDAQWLASICHSAQTCVEVGSKMAAGPTLEILRPFTDRNAAGAMSLVFLGPVASFAAPLAQLVGDHESAEALGTKAIAASDQVGDVFNGAKSRLDRASFLLDAEPSANRHEASSLVEASRLALDRFGLEELRARADALEQRLAEFAVDTKPSAASEPLPADTPVATEPKETEAIFVREGDTWKLGWEGQSMRLRQQRGLEFIAAMLQHPNEEIHARTLMSASPAPATDATTRAALASGDLAIADDGGLEVLDDQALQAFRSRFEQARNELAEAEANHDLGRVEILQHEIDFLAQELAGATGLQGRKRRTGSDNERARVAVRKRVKAALDRIRRDLPGMHAHLSASLRTGSVCRYSPESPVAWASRI